MSKTLKAGDLAETPKGQIVTVLAFNREWALFQYANGVQGKLPVTDLEPRGPKTEPIQTSAFRIPPDVKQAAAARAEKEGVTLTSVIVEFLEKYAAGKRVA